MSVTLPINVSTRRMAAVTCTAGQTAIPYNFPLLRQEDIRVTRTRGGAVSELVIGTDFTVSGVGNANGGTVTLTVGATAGDIIVVDGDAVISRLSSIIQNGRFSSAQIDLELDLAVIRDQELRRDVDVLAAAPAFAALQETIEDIIGASIQQGPGISTVYDDTTGKTTVSAVGLAGGGSGNVVGPLSAVNDRIMVSDGTTGRLLKDGGQTIAGLTSSILGAVQGGGSRTINGGMMIDQVNNGSAINVAAGATGYPVDRWAVYNNTPGATISAGRQGFGPFGLQHMLRCWGAAGHSGGTVYQRIESVSIADRAGYPVLLSAVLQSNANRGVSWSVRYANAVDTWGGSTLIATGTINVTTSPQRFDIPITLPAQAANGVQIAFDLPPLGAGATLDFSGIDLIPGSIPMAFERRPFGLELALCQRFLPVYNFRGGNDLVGFGYSISTTQSLIMVPFPVTPRIAPTGLTVTNPTFFVLRNGSNVGGFATSMAVATNGSFSAGSIVVNTTAGSPTLTAGQGAFLFSGTPPSQIIFTGCELN